MATVAKRGVFALFRRVSLAQTTRETALGRLQVPSQRPSASSDARLAAARRLQPVRVVSAGLRHYTLSVNPAPPGWTAKPRGGGGARLAPSCGALPASARSASQQGTAPPGARRVCGVCAATQRHHRAAVPPGGGFTNSQLFEEEPIGRRAPHLPGSARHTGKRGGGGGSWHPSPQGGTWGIFGTHFCVEYRHASNCVHMLLLYGLCRSLWSMSPRWHGCWTPRPRSAPTATRLCSCTPRTWRVCS